MGKRRITTLAASAALVAGCAISASAAPKSPPVVGPVPSNEAMVVPPGARPLPASALADIAEWRRTGVVPPLPVAGPDGQPMRDPNGNLVLVDPATLHPLPPAPPPRLGDPPRSPAPGGGGR